IVYDTDWGFFNVNHNTLAFVTNPAGTGVGRYLSTVLMVNLLHNPDFKAEFITRLAYHLNHTFTPERVIGRIDEMACMIEAEMPNQIKRWGGSMNEWYFHIQRLRNFAQNRPAIMLHHIKNKFKLSNEQMKIFDAW
ncbi:MAG: CotH kinase family protein, partial [Firmicutes bacterium]|nr:CotH kinase family protein [Bacillota bacterium]